jgi:hypothetical protein
MNMTEKTTEMKNAEICFRRNRPAVQHTPGPLTVRRDYHEAFAFWMIVPRCDQEQVLACILCRDNEFEWSARAEANAQLFASAPELLQALQALLLAGPCKSAQYDAAVAQALLVIGELEK